MLKVTSFDDDSLDSFFDTIDKDRQQADEQVQSWQDELKAGDHFLRLVEVGGGGVVAIYGEIETCTYEEDKELYALPHMKHYRPSRCYSVMCPQGEYGDVHVSSIHKKLSPTQFELAKEMEWPSDNRVRRIVEMS